MDDEGDKRYPRRPGFVAGSETSRDAAESAEEFAGSMADRCERWFKRCAERGQLRTCEECELAAKEAGHLGKHESISARIRTDLFLKRGCIYKIATDKTTGAQVSVWRNSDTTNLITNKRGEVVFEKRRNTSGRKAVLYGWGYDESGRA